MNECLYNEYAEWNITRFPSMIAVDKRAQFNFFV